MADQVPFTDRFDADSATFDSLQRDLWSAAGDAVAPIPPAPAPALYVESLNDMIDTHTDRVVRHCATVCPHR